MIYMRFPGGKKKALTLSYDDGVEQDVKLIQIMTKYGLKGTFNINSGLYGEEGFIQAINQPHRRMTKAQSIALYREHGMEVAVHGLKHLNLTKLSPIECFQEIVQDRQNLEEQFQTIIRGMAYAGNAYNDQVIDCIKGTGIVYSRIVGESGNFRIPRDWFRLEPTCHHDAPRLSEYMHRFIEEDVKNVPWLFYLWGHSYEFDANDNWHVIEDFARYMGKREDIWYATNIEIYKYVEAYRKLIFSADQKRIQNPTAYVLYYESDGEIYSINPLEEKVGEWK